MVLLKFHFKNRPLHAAINHTYHVALPQTDKDLLSNTQLSRQHFILCLCCWLAFKDGTAKRCTSAMMFDAMKNAATQLVVEMYRMFSAKYRGVQKQHQKRESD